MGQGGLWRVAPDQKIAAGIGTMNATDNPVRGVEYGFTKTAYRALGFIGLFVGFVTRRAGFGLPYCEKFSARPVKGGAIDT